jgi:hypothetical protein
MVGADIFLDAASQPMSVVMQSAQPGIFHVGVTDSHGSLPLFPLRGPLINWQAMF